MNNNKENCFLLINEKIIELRRFINLSEIFDDSYLITFWPLTLHVKLILKKSKSSIDLSFMFYEISTISSKTIFDNLNNVKITKMNYMFYNCSSLKQLPNISEINTSNVTDMSYMFYNCSSLTSMSDISRWDTRNVVDISHIFQNCELLTSIPDISQWKADNIKEMDDIFNNCKSLSSLPNISKWNIKENNKENNMFEGCTLLEENIKYNSSTFTRIILDCLEKCTNFFDRSSFAYCFSISLLIFFICFRLYFIFSPAYISFNLDKLKEYSTNPIKSFDLIKYSNITYIIENLKITDLVKIQEIYENKEEFIINITNFTIINGNMKFESSQNILKIFNIIYSIVGIIKILLYSFAILNVKFDFIKIKTILLFTLILIINIISSIFEILDFIYSQSLLNSLNILREKIEKLFRIIIPKEYIDEIEKINDIGGMAIINFILSVIIILCFMCECKKIIQKNLTLKTFNDYLFNRNNIIK